MQTIYAMGTPALLLNRRLRHIDGRRVVEDKASRLRASAAPVMKPNPNFGKPGDSPPKGSVLVASSYGRDYQALLRASRAGWGVIVQRSA